MSKSLALLALASTALAGAKSLADIKHVVFLMKENRAFDHVSELPSNPSDPGRCC